MDLTPQYYGADVSQRWIFSYADVLTILLVLFVAMSAQGLRKLDARPARAAAPVKPPSRADPRAELLRAEASLEQRGLSPKLEERGLVISLPQAVLFPSGEDEVSPAALPVVAQVAEVIRDMPNKVTLIGHADDVPIHNRRFKDNWVLSVARGLSLLEALNKRYGIPQARLSVAGYGSYSPRESNDTADRRAQNRRVEIVILDQPAP